MPKNRNGFFIFCLEMKSSLIQKGHRFHNMHSLMELASPHWEKLSDEEKEVFKVKAKFSDAEMTENSVRKRKRLTCLGDDIDELQERLDIQRETYDKMVNEIKRLVTDASDLGGTFENFGFDVFLIFCCSRT